MIINIKNKYLRLLIIIITVLIIVPFLPFLSKLLQTDSSWQENIYYAYICGTLGILLLLFYIPDYITTSRITKIVEQLKDKGINIEISNSLPLKSKIVGIIGLLIIFISILLI